MNILASIKRPEYIFRPSQIIRRLRHEFRSSSVGYEVVQLPWGLPLRVQPSESIGAVISRAGVHELPVCEVIGRLVDPGDIAVDTGANIGQMTSLMAMRAGPKGEVIAFEPHPAIFQELQHNISVWQQSSFLAPTTACNAALSDHMGIAQLMVPTIFNSNHGIAFLAGTRRLEVGKDWYEVPVTVLDASVTAGRQVGLLKIDVEGHELKVLEGARHLVASDLIRDIVFEDWGAPPTPSIKFLESAGYTIYRIERKLFGPMLVPAAAPHTDALENSANYLATRDSRRALARMAKPGWAVYSGRWPKS